MLLILFTFFCTTFAVDLKSLVFIILSQNNDFHMQQAGLSRDNLLQQSRNTFHVESIIHFSNQDFPKVPGWTVIQLLPILGKLHGDNATWIIFLEDYTAVNLHNLVQTLDKYNSSKEIWIGHAIHDIEPTIIHHFTFAENPELFKYPIISAGFAISSPLLQRLSQTLLKKPTQNAFTIDVSHELALFMKEEHIILENESAFCIVNKSSCATFPTKYNCCNNPLPINSVYYAVKTCEKYHKDRVKVVKNTWGQHASNIQFFSDVVDSSIPTINVGVPNTERGHCEKTLSILKYVNKKVRKKKIDVSWIVLADDDTVLSISRLHYLLSRYDAKNPIAVGEMYGFRLLDGPVGYAYLTGGAGIAFTISAVQILATKCSCPAIDSPDDMIIGACLASEGVEVIRSSAFHQARPSDYNPDYLAAVQPVSFHKHWNVDPISVYRHWFKEDDDRFSQRDRHSEL